MTNQPLVSIITVNYNQSEVTCDLLSSLRHITYKNIEIIVVDNNSTKDNPSVIKKRFPEIVFIESSTNLGFAGGNNLGIRKSKGDFLMFLNNDTTVPPDFLEPLVNFMIENPTVGIASPKIKFYWSPSTVQYAGFTEMNPYTVRNSGIGYNKPDGPEYDNISKTAYVHGAAMIVPRRVIEEVGLIPEVYFLYYEEHDWVEMIKRAGYYVYYLPISYILHKESVTTGRDSAFKTYYISRSRIIFARRNYNGLTRVANLIFQTFISLPKNILINLIKLNFKIAYAYIRSYIWNLLNYRALKQNPKL